MRSRVAFIGFGEAGAAFARAADVGYDRKLDHPDTRPSKLADFLACEVRPCGSSAEALEDAATILSLVTADQALAAAQENAPQLAPKALWFDMNSVAPATKRAAAAAIEPTGRYVDVAVMSPVHPGRRATPLLLSGPHAAAGEAALRAAGFSSVRSAGSKVGDASAIKVIRSVMVKGLEALSVECALAAEAAGVRSEVVASLDASWPGADWERRLDYNLERMMVHGLRRAEEMEEVVKALDALGFGSGMARATTARQRDIGNLALPPPVGLGPKLDALRAVLSRLEDAA